MQVNDRPRRYGIENADGLIRHLKSDVVFINGSIDVLFDLQNSILNDECLGFLLWLGKGLELPLDLVTHFCLVFGVKKKRLNVIELSDLFAYILQ